MSGASTITLRCDAARSQLTLEPSFGCVATSWLVDEAELLALPAPREEFLRSTRTGGIPLLYPYANRLRTDRFLCAGLEVDLSRELSLKRDAGGLPIHGLLLRWPHWVLTQPSESALCAKLDWAAHSWLMHAYPFGHTLELRWELTKIADQAALTITTTIHADRDTPVPIAFGWHPYFLARSPSAATAEFPSMREVKLLPSGVPSVPLTLDPNRRHLPVSIGSGVDALFQIESPSSQVVLREPTRSIAIEFLQGYRWMQAFSPLGANYVAIEPMTAPTSALSDGSAAVIPSGESTSASFCVQAPCRKN